MAAGAGVKLLTAFPGNADVGMEPYQGDVLLFDAANGAPRARVEGSRHGIVVEVREGARL